MGNEVRFYKGKHKVKVVTQSVGYWIVEALEPFEDTLDGAVVTVQVGEKRIVPPRSVHKQQDLPPIVKKPMCELQMEKKLKRKVDEKKKPKKTKKHKKTAKKQGKKNSLL